MISVRNLVKSYGKVRALKGVSLEFSGGIAGLIGPNGAGKSTLIKILIGLLRQDSGEAYIMGEEAWRNRKILRRIGVLHERPRPPGWVSGRRFLEHVCKIKEVDDLERQIKLVSEWLNLEKYLDRNISSYSSGMVQRVSIAAALVGDPELVIMDEPTANLDPRGRITLMQVLRNLKNSGTSFFISSHILPELERVCDSVFFLSSGKVLRGGSMEELRSLGSYVLSFSGCPELLELVRDAGEVLVRDGRILVRSRKVDHLVGCLAKYVLEGGKIPQDLELRPPTLDEIFLLLEGSV